MGKLAAGGSLLLAAFYRSGPPQFKVWNMELNAIDRAHELLNNGVPRRAAGELERAGKAGDGTALVELAIWFIAGIHVPRDMARAAELMKAAASLDLDDAIVMHAAMLANGAGAPPNWKKAKSILSAYATRIPSAEEQLHILSLMALDLHGDPTRGYPSELLHHSPRIVRFPSFLTELECTYIAETSASLLEPALIVDPRNGHQIPHPVRTSDGGAIGPLRENLVIRAVNQRIAVVSATNVDQGEPLTVLRYRPGQQYRSHLDTISGVSNQRIRTMIIYLNEGFHGGHTTFTELPLAIAPRAGDAILFDNLDAAGCPDPKSRHAGLPVTNGAKWIATRWIRANRYDPWAGG